MEWLFAEPDPSLNFVVRFRKRRKGYIRRFQFAAETMVREGKMFLVDANFHILYA